MRDAEHVLFVVGGEQSSADKIVEIALVGWKRRRGTAFGGHDRVVIPDLRVVHETLSEGTCAGARRNESRVRRSERRHHVGQCELDIARQIATVRTRIADELVLFVEILQNGERSLGGEAINAIRVALKLGQVVEHGRRNAPRLALHLGDFDRGLRRASACANVFGFFAVLGKTHGLRATHARAQVTSVVLGRCVARSCAFR